VAAALPGCGIKGPLKPPPGKAAAGAPPAQAPIGGTLPSETPTSITPQGGEAPR
jgi:predicted small lipoprotein YifL